MLAHGFTVMSGYSNVSYLALVAGILSALWLVKGAIDA